MKVSDVLQSDISKNYSSGVLKSSLGKKFLYVKVLQFDNASGRSRILD